MNTHNIHSATPGLRWPAKAYFQMANMGKFGFVICELSVCEAGDISAAARAIEDDTVSIWLLEDGVLTNASEDVAAEWMRLFRNEIDFDLGEALVVDFIRNNAGDLVADLEGEVATAKLNEQHHPEHLYFNATAMGLR